MRITLNHSRLQSNMSHNTEKTNHTNVNTTEWEIAREQLFKSALQRLPLPFINRFHTHDFDLRTRRLDGAYGKLN